MKFSFSLSDNMSSTIIIFCAIISILLFLFIGLNILARLEYNQRYNDCVDNYQNNVLSDLNNFESSECVRQSGCFVPCGSYCNRYSPSVGVFDFIPALRYYALKDVIPCSSQCRPTCLLKP